MRKLSRRHAGWIAPIALLSLAAAPASAQQWWPQFDNEFNWVGQVDTGQWTYDIGNGNWGWGNGEAEYYTNRTQNLYTDGNVLVIKANLESYGGFNYTSARIDTIPAWTYGSLLIRAQLPTGRGVWPAIWMLPNQWTYGNGGWPDNGEIDIMEQVGYDPNTIHFTLHDHNGAPSNTVGVANAASSYHEYRVDWAPDHIAGFVDGNQYFWYSRNGQDWQGWPFDKPFHLILNDAIGGTWGGSQGIDNSIFPQYFFIDYVRVYKMGSTSYLGTPPNMPGRIEAENYDNGGQDYAYHTTLSNNPGGQYRNDQVGIEANNDGYPGYNVGWIGTDTWLRYTFNATQSKTYGMTFRVASPYSGKSFNVIVDDAYVGTVAVPNTGGWQNWTTVQIPNFANLSAGVHRVTLLANSDGNFNINWFDIW